MKRILSISLILISLIMASCSNELGNNDNTVSVRLAKSTSRALDASDIEIVSSEDVYWTYTATKTDKGFSTGATREESNLNGGNKGLGSARLELSTGAWSFTLKGYTDLEDKDNTKVYEGASAEIITADTKTISISVEYVGSSLKGSVMLDAVTFTAIDDLDGIKVDIISSSGTTVKTIELNKDSDGTFSYGEKIELDSGIYQFKMTPSANGSYDSASAVTQGIVVAPGNTVNLSGNVKEKDKGTISFKDIGYIMNDSVDRIVVDIDYNGTSIDSLELIKDSTTGKFNVSSGDSVLILDVGTYSLKYTAYSGSTMIEEKSKSATITANSETAITGDVSEAGTLTISDVTFGSLLATDRIKAEVSSSSGTVVATSYLEKGDNGKFSLANGISLVPGTYSVAFTPMVNGSERADKANNIDSIVIEKDTEYPIANKDISDGSAPDTGKLTLKNIGFTGSSTSKLTVSFKPKTVDDITLPRNSSGLFSSSSDISIEAGSYEITFTGTDGTSVTKTCTIEKDGTYSITGDISGSYTVDSDENYVVKEATKEALEAAIKAAGSSSNSTTVKLDDNLGAIALGDYPYGGLDIDIPGGNVAIDLNGNTISGEISSLGSTLKITDSSSAKTGMIDGSIAVQAGTFTLDGSKVSSSVFAAITVSSGATANIKGSIVESSSGSYAINTSGTVNISDDSTITNTASGGQAIVVNDGTTTIENGTITSDNIAVWINGGTYTQKEGKVSCENSSGIICRSGTVNIAGGSVTGNGISVDIEADGKLNISGGTINSGSAGSDLAVCNEGTMTMTGGNIISENGQCYEAKEGSTTTISGGTIHSSSSNMPAIIIQEEATYTQTGGTVISDSNIGIQGKGGTANITGGSVTGGTYSIVNYSDNTTAITVGDSVTTSAPNDIIITYHTNYDSDTQTKQNKYWGIGVKLQAGITRSGYDFNGWNTSSDGNGTAYSAGATYTGNENVVLYAIWSEHIDYYTIVYYANGGSGSTITETARVGEASTIKGQGSFSNSAYKFVGWSTLPSGGGKWCIANDTYSGSADSTLILYAQWRIADYSLMPGVPTLLGGSNWATIRKYYGSSGGTIPSTVIHYSGSSTVPSSTLRDSEIYYLCDIGVNDNNTYPFVGLTSLTIDGRYISGTEPGAFKYCAANFVLTIKNMTISYWDSQIINKRSDVSTTKFWESRFPTGATVILSDGIRTYDANL